MLSGWATSLPSVEVHSRQQNVQHCMERLDPLHVLVPCLLHQSTQQSPEEEKQPLSLISTSSCVSTDLLISPPLHLQPLPPCDPLFTLRKFQFYVKVSPTWAVCALYLTLNVPPFSGVLHASPPISTLRFRFCPCCITENVPNLLLKSINKAQSFFFFLWFLCFELGWHPTIALPPEFSASCWPQV